MLYKRLGEASKSKQRTLELWPITWSSLSLKSCFKSRKQWSAQICLEIAWFSLLPRRQTRSAIYGSQNFDSHQISNNHRTQKEKCVRQIATKVTTSVQQDNSKIIPKSYNLDCFKRNRNLLLSQFCHLVAPFPIEIAFIKKNFKTNFSQHP